MQAPSQPLARAALRMRSLACAQPCVRETLRARSAARSFAHLLIDFVRHQYEALGGGEGEDALNGGFGEGLTGRVAAVHGREYGRESKPPRRERHSHCAPCAAMSWEGSPRARTD